MFIKDKNAPFVRVILGSNQSWRFNFMWVYQLHLSLKDAEDTRTESSNSDLNKAVKLQEQVLRTIQNH